MHVFGLFFSIYYYYNYVKIVRFAVQHNKHTNQPGIIRQQTVGNKDNDKMFTYHLVI